MTRRHCLLFVASKRRRRAAIHTTAFSHWRTSTLAIVVLVLAQAHAWTATQRRKNYHSCMVYRTSSLGMVDPWRQQDSESVPIVIGGSVINNGAAVNDINGTNSTDATTASFGQVVPLRRPTQQSISNNGATSVDTAASVSSSNSNNTPELEQLQNMKSRNTIVAILSIVLAVTNYLWQFTHPVTPVQLLVDMQQSSVPLTVIGANAKPTLVDFWAPWCENCKLMAPTLQAIEQEYGDTVNFVMVNGDERDSWPAIEAFGVDAIPHLALVSASGDVETALIGPIPQRVLRADLDVLLENSACNNGGVNMDNDKKDATTVGQSNDDLARSDRSICVEKALPFTMLDVFEGRPPEQRRIKF